MMEMEISRGDFNRELVNWIKSRTITYIHNVTDTFTNGDDQTDEIVDFILKSSFD